MCASCMWEDYLSILEGILETGDFNWAFDTLNGIFEWVEEHQHITPKQIETVEKIKRRGEDGDAYSE